MPFGNTVEFAQMSLRLVPKILNAVDMIFLVCEKFGMVDATVLEIRYIQHVVSSPAIRIDDAVRDDFLLDNGH